MADPTTIVEAHFDSDEEGFAYLDDTFRSTSQPGFADGAYLSSGGYSGGGLQVELGDINNDIINGMSGGWSLDFAADGAQNVMLSFAYKLTIGADYESDECGEVLASVGGTLYGQDGSDYIARLCGNGNGGSDDTTGWSQALVDLGTLSAGSHTLILGGYNNKKTYSNEWTEVLIDDVQVYYAEPPPPILAADFESGTGTFSYLDDTFRNTSEPAYADGAYLPSGGFGGSAGLQVTLGGIDNASVYGMSGGWHSSFVLTEAMNLTISFRYRLAQSPDYDQGEYSQALVSLDGGLVPNGSVFYVDQVAGDGNGGSEITTGWQLYSASVGAIPAGEHDLIIGAFNNQKTADNESTEALIDDVLVTGTPELQQQRIDYGTAVWGYHGAVTSGGDDPFGPTEAGIEILAAGGNAFDAAAATILALTESDYTMVHFGGEVPILFYHPASGQIKVYSGQGPAPELATLQYFVDNHGGRIPGTGGNIENATVPGLLLAVLTMLKDYGTMTFEEVAAPLLALLSGQGGWRGQMYNTLTDLIAADVNTRAGGGTRGQGITAVRDLFYSGTLADSMINWIVSDGGLLRKSDLQTYAAGWTPLEDPLSVQYQDFTVYKVGPWTQGPYLLEVLQILEPMNLRSMGHNSGDHIHASVEALKLGLADRDKWFADPDFEYVPVVSMISEDYADIRRPLIDMSGDPGSASFEFRPGDPDNLIPVIPFGAFAAGPEVPVGDTSTCIAADRWGNVVVATPSGWGGTLIGNSTGVWMNSRLVSANTWDGHPNVVEPFKRPRITLTPTLVFRDGLPVIGLSIAGGDQQDQTALQLFSALVDFGYNAGESVGLPRYSTAHHYNSFGQSPPDLGSLTLNYGLPSGVVSDLDSRGHDINQTNSARAWPSVMVFHHNAGLIEASGDGSAERYAAGYSDLSDAPTAVTLAAFRGEPQEGAILLTWETPSEADLLGFNLYRSPAGGGPLTQLNQDLIPAQAPGSPVGASYQYEDSLAQPGAAYEYWLDMVDVHGGAQRHGPVCAALAAEGRILLPLVIR